MTTSHAEPHDTSPSRLRSALPWAIACVTVVVAAVVVMVVLTPGETGDGDRSAPATSAPARSAGPGTDHDLSTPEAAARSFVSAARTGSGDALLDLACAGHPECVREHSAGVSEAALTEMRDAIRDGVYELAVHLEDAEFATAVDGAEPGTKDVPYRTPAMAADAYLTLTFVQSGGDWLYYRPAA